MCGDTAAYHVVRQPLNNVYKLQNGLKVLCSYSGRPVKRQKKGNSSGETKKLVQMYIVTSPT